jgi:hypothetical protein
MDDTQRLKGLLTRAADLAGPPFEAPPAERFMVEPPRRHHGWGLAAAVVTVLALDVSVTWRARLREQATPLATPNPSPTPGSVSVAPLARYKWSTLPPAPIAGRDAAVGVWTGTQMFVWGGASGRDAEILHADGAAYDPDTRTWTTLPASPLSPRAQPASVWTGTSLFIWGGSVDSDGTVATDGALYTPAEHSWTRLPAAPVTDYREVRAFWTGRVVVVLSTSPPARSDGSSHEVNAQSYDPATRSWTRLPDLRLPAGHAADQVIYVGAGTRIHLWSLWSLDTPTGPGSVTTAAGVDAYTLDVDKRRWASNRLVLPNHAISRTPLWTGREIAMPAITRWLGAVPGPRPANVSGLMLDPANGSTRPIRHGPVDDLNADYLWTGTALLAFNTSTEESGPHEHVYPGRAAAWDPATDRWTALPDAPLAGSDTIAVWTGRTLLIWGELYTPRGAKHVATTGLQYAP